MEADGARLPRFGEASLADVATWVGSTLGLADDLPAENKMPRITGIDRIVLLVFDGLGERQVIEYADACPFISKMDGTCVTSTFPSTTASALTSLCTGTVPGEHGIVGYVFKSPAGILNVVKYTTAGNDARKVLDPDDLQSRPTLFEVFSDAGAQTWVVTADAFRGSGFTNVFLRGGLWRGWRSAAEMPVIVSEILPLGMRSLVYAYYDGVDTAGHVSGVGSDRYMAQLAKCDQLAESIGRSLGRGEAMVVLADHGMVNVTESGRSYIDDEIESLCSGIGGEARCRYLYAVDGAQDRLLTAARERWHDTAWVFSRGEAAKSGLFGSNPGPEILKRVGDIVVSSRDGTTGLFRRNRRKPLPIGNHGSLTQAEVEVPFRIVVG